MGEARKRGTFEERKAQAIAAGRSPEARRRLQRMYRVRRAEAEAAYLDFIQKLIAHEAMSARVTLGLNGVKHG